MPVILFYFIYVMNFCYQIFSKLLISHRDADVMREKQKLAEEKKAAEAAGAAKK